MPDPVHHRSVFEMAFREVGRRRCVKLQCELSALSAGIVERRQGSTVILENCRVSAGRWRRVSLEMAVYRGPESFSSISSSTTRSYFSDPEPAALASRVRDNRHRIAVEGRLGGRKVIPSTHEPRILRVN